MRGPHLQLLLVFAFVWGALGVYSVIERDITVGDVTLEKTEIKALLGLDSSSTEPRADQGGGAVGDTADLEPASPASGAITPAAGPSTSARPALPPLDTQPQRIMIVGDSMVVNLIPPLADYCLENGHKLFPVIWYASTTVAWAAQSKLNDVIREFSPTYVIMVLGSSELRVRNVDKRARWVRRINERIGERHFFWLGPPNWREDTGFNDMLLKTVGPGHYFRSADIELERESDGIHPTRTAGRKWTDRFARWMATEAAVRIPMKPPTKKATPPSAKTYPPPYEVQELHRKQKQKP